MLRLLLFRSLPCALALALLTSSAPAQTSTQPPADQARIRSYIAAGWEKLSRSMADCASVVDPKVTAVPVLYLPAGMPIPAPVRAMQNSCHVDVRNLPRPIHSIGDLRPSDLSAEGLLYLPNRYVVPGGRFNEMYGWDSYFNLLGLLEDHRPDLARGMVENFFFEIQNYGAILNANRTYYLTRSQPPFLSSMIRAIYEDQVRSGHPDLNWLQTAYGFAQQDHALWTSPQHLAGNTGLARYHDLGSGPVPEMADDSTYYPDVIRWLLAHPHDHPEYLVKASAHPDHTEIAVLARTSCDITRSHVCADAVVDGHRLSKAFYAGDRAMRESGFDTTFRFGPFSGSTTDFAPVGLNSLLFRYEQDMADFAKLLGLPAASAHWNNLATTRRAAIDRYLWNPSAGIYVDYNYVKHRQSAYHYITTFYPLWAGAASPAQAASIEKHLNLFERPGGLATSDVVSGVQWDAPYGWAPTTWLATSALSRYGFTQDAARISNKFSSTILENFVHDGTIREKYNVVSSSANVEVSAGYKANVIGFGWTNAVYLKMRSLLSSPSNIPPPTKADSSQSQVSAR
jgi:alpha,alpha-trehalase